MLQKLRRIFADPPQPADARVPKENEPEPRISRLQREATDGNVEAMYRLGSIYFSGDGVPRNPKSQIKDLLARQSLARLRDLKVPASAKAAPAGRPARTKEWLKKAEDIDIMLKAMGLVWGVGE